MSGNKTVYTAKYLRWYYPCIIGVELYFVLTPLWRVTINPWVMFLTCFNTIIAGYVTSCFIDFLTQYLLLEFNVRQRYKRLFRYRNRK